MEPTVLIHEVESRIEDQELRGGVHGPAEQDEESVERPEGFGTGKEESQDDGDVIDDAAPASNNHAPVVETLLSFEYPVDAEVDVDEEVEYDGDETAGC